MIPLSLDSEASKGSVYSGEGACSQLRKLLRDSSRTRCNLKARAKCIFGYIVRPGADGMQFGMSSEEKPGKNDEVSEQHGLKVLVDRLSLRTLDGVVLSHMEDGGFSLGKPADAATDSAEA